MELEGKVKECFRDSLCPIFQEHELEKQLEKDGKAKGDLSSLSNCLKTMVDKGTLGSRTLSSGNSEITVYWPQDEDHAEQSSKSPSTTTCGSLKQRTKRPRSSFVSPLLSDRFLSSSGRQKKPKLDLASKTLGDSCSTSQCTGTVKGRLDFDEVHQSCPMPLKSDKTDNTTDSSSAGTAGVDCDVARNEEQTKKLLEERIVLEARINDQKEELRKLRMVKMYRTKNDHQGLDQLIVKWREVAQEVAQSLLESSSSEPRPSMGQLLDYLHIDCSLIHYSSEEEAFY